jgi:hypothetical protein
MGNLLKTQEEIEIITIFTKKGPQPHIFKWAGKRFIIEKINLIFTKKLGDDKLVYFSVTSQDNYFKLVFNTNNLKWFIEEVYHE